MTMPQRWSVRDAPPEEVEALASSCSIQPLVAHCLVARGVKSPAEAEALLHAPLEALHDPFDMRDMDRAVEAVAAVRSIDRSACRNDVEQRFSDTRMAQDYVRAYQKILEL